MVAKDEDGKCSIVDGKLSIVNGKCLYSILLDYVCIAAFLTYTRSPDSVPHRPLM